jgi:Tat protein secretion system quality control protein TatD with DNase activity
VPKRGTRCEPAFVVHTLSALANARDEEVAVVEAATTANARSLFRLDA